MTVPAYSIVLSAKHAPGATMYTASEAVSAVYRAWGCIEVASCFVAIVTSGIKITAAMPDSTATHIHHFCSYVQ